MTPSRTTVANASKQSVLAKVKSLSLLFVALDASSPIILISMLEDGASRSKREKVK
jgi:hypothetical protein